MQTYKIYKHITYKKCNNLVPFDWFGFIMFNATFNNISVISWRSILLMEETRGPGENHQHVASH
jgi:hypothetical protein